MSLQHQRITELCEQLKLAGLGAQWPALAQDAARDESSFADFLEKVLASEVVLRDERRTTTLMKLATMPAVKTLEQFDWSCAGGAPKAQIQELAHLAFVQRAENVVLLGPSGVGKDPHRTGLGPAGRDRRAQGSVHQRGRPDAAAGGGQGPGAPEGIL